MLFLRNLLPFCQARLARKKRTRSERCRTLRRGLQVELLEEKVVLATFAVIGDYGDSGPGELAVADMVKSWNPEAILTLGDNNYGPPTAAAIDANIGQYYHDYIGNYQGSYGAGSPTNRFMPILGNHDWDGGGQAYFDYFTLPGNERYYDFVLDNVHFFALDSDSQEPDGIASNSVQADWLRDGLANSQEMFNVVYLHHAPYSSDAGIGSTSIMRWPFQEWGADAVLAGHTHQYERLYVDGLPYFVNGLGGAEIKPFGSPIAGSQVRYNDDFGAMRIVTSSTTLRFEFLSIDGGGSLVDSYTLGASGVVNDQFADAVTLDGISLTAEGTNVASTFESGEPYNVSATGGRSVWWNWTASVGGSVTLATAGSNFDTTLGVYQGAEVSSLTKVAANDDQSGSILTSRLTFVAVAGQTYRISVDGYDGAMGEIALQLDVAASPANDAFGSRTILQGEHPFATGTNAGATSEQGEPKNAGVTGGKSVWWSWTAPTSGTVTISTAGSSFDTTLGVYTGSSVSALNQVAANDDEKGSIRSSLVSFSAVAGTVYQVSVDGYQAASGDIALSIDMLVSPVNDSFLNRSLLSGASVTAAGSNVNATKESGEPNHAGNSGGRSLWWSWTAPSSGTVTMSTAGSSFDTTLGIYTGSSVNALTTVASNDDQSGSNVSSRVTFAALAGTVYQIAVDGYGGVSGDIALAIDLVASPVNDSFASRAVLSGASVTATGSNVNATKESGEPNHAGNSGGRSTWWSWTAPSSGTVTMSTAGSSFDTTMGVYTGSSVNALTAVASNDDQSGSIRSSLVRFSAVAGTVYQIAVDGYGGVSGDIALSIDLVSSPVNDSFLSRVLLSGTSATASGSNVNASKESGEPSHAGVPGGRSVWWSWTAPSSGTVTISTAGSTFDTTLGVYTGSSVNALTAVASNDDQTGSIRSSLVTFAAVAGTTYQIAVDGYEAASGDVSLSVDLLP